MSVLLFVYSLTIALALAIPEPPREPWSTTDEYFKVVERGFRLDSMPHNVHFVERGKLLEVVTR